MKLILICDESNAPLFSQAYQSIRTLYGYIDAYFIFHGQRIFLSSLRDTNFTRVVDYLNVQQFFIVLTFIKRYTKETDRFCYDYRSEYNVNRDIVFLPFNWYTYRFVYWDNTALIRGSNGYYRLFSCGNMVLGYVRELKNTDPPTSGGSALSYLVDFTPYRKTSPNGRPVNEVAPFSYRQVLYAKFPLRTDGFSITFLDVSKLSDYEKSNISSSVFVGTASAITNKSIISFPSYAALSSTTTRTVNLPFQAQLITGDQIDISINFDYDVAPIDLIQSYQFPIIGNEILLFIPQTSVRSGQQITSQKPTHPAELNSNLFPNALWGKEFNGFLTTPLSFSTTVKLGVFSPTPKLYTLSLITLYFPQYLAFNSTVFLSDMKLANKLYDFVRCNSSRRRVESNRDASLRGSVVEASANDGISRVTFNDYSDIERLLSSREFTNCALCPNSPGYVWTIDSQNLQTSKSLSSTGSLSTIKWKWNASRTICSYDFSFKDWRVFASEGIQTFCSFISPDYPSFDFLRVALLDSENELLIPPFTLTTPFFNAFAIEAQRINFTDNIDLIITDIQSTSVCHIDVYFKTPPIPSLTIDYSDDFPDPINPFLLCFLNPPDIFSYYNSFLPSQTDGAVPISSTASTQEALRFSLLEYDAQTPRSLVSRIFYPNDTIETTVDHRVGGYIAPLLPNDTSLDRSFIKNDSYVIATTSNEQADFTKEQYVFCIVPLSNSRDFSYGFVENQLLQSNLTQIMSLSLNDFPSIDDVRGVLTDNPQLAQTPINEIGGFSSLKYALFVEYDSINYNAVTTVANVTNTEEIQGEPGLQDSYNLLRRADNLFPSYQQVCVRQTELTQGIRLFRESFNIKSYLQNELIVTSMLLIDVTLTDNLIKNNEGWWDLISTLQFPQNFPSFPYFALDYIADLPDQSAYDNDYVTAIKTDLSVATFNRFHPMTTINNLGKHITMRPLAVKKNFRISLMTKPKTSKITLILQFGYFKQQYTFY